jgi:AP-1 complex subunit beta-1
VAAGQQAENLLDFDDAPATDGQPSGLAATEVLSSTPAAANLLAGTSSNPLDDLVSIFGGGQNGMGGLSIGGGSGFGAPMAPNIQVPAPMTMGQQSPASVSPAQAQKPQEDLLGLF